MVKSPESLLASYRSVAAKDVTQESLVLRGISTIKYIVNFCHTELNYNTGNIETKLLMRGHDCETRTDNFFKTYSIYY